MTNLFIRLGGVAALCLTQTVVGPALAAESPAAVDRFITGLSDAANGGVTANLASCSAFPKPGDDSVTLDSCVYMLGGGKMAIVNAEQGGGIADVAIQPWPLDQTGDAIAWVASALGAADTSGANDLAQAAAADEIAEGTIGGIGFVVLKMGDAMTVTAFPNSN